jgi:hypothetical protein
MSVCPGGQLMLSCSTPNGSYTQWNVWSSVFSPLSSGNESKLFTKGGSETVNDTPVVINQTVFHFSKISDSPLISVLSVVNVTSDINQTRIDCFYTGGMSRTIIDVIANNDGEIFIENSIISKLFIY